MKKNRGVTVSIKKILSTPVGKRVMQHSFGSDLKTLVKAVEYEPCDTVTAKLLKENFVHMIKKYCKKNISESDICVSISSDTITVSPLTANGKKVLIEINEENRIHIEQELT
jgi:phage baseplate assembly protein W